MTSTPSPNTNVQSQRPPQTSQAAENERVYGRRLRWTAEIRIQGQQEAGLLHKTQVGVRKTPWCTQR